MALTLKNFAKELKKDLLKAAAKSTVRECDETGKGVFVAYVDEGAESYDAMLTLSADGEVVKSSCDCNDGSIFCRHRVSLLMCLAAGAKTSISAAKKTVKKITAAEKLLAEAEAGALKEWVRNLILNNKDIELSFTRHFQEKKQYYTPEEVIKLVNDAVRASGCNKKNIDASQIKKLTELWREVLRPVIDYYYSNLTGEKAFRSFHTMLDECLQLPTPGKSLFTRILRFVEDATKPLPAAINNLKDDADWFTAACFFARNIIFDKYNIRGHYLALLRNIIDAEPNQEKRAKLIEQMASAFERLSGNHGDDEVLFAKVLFEMVKNNELLPRYYQVFRPLRFQNDFNHELIQFLIDNDQLALACKYCGEQIAANYHEEYNLPYLELLRQIYTIQNDEKGLGGIAEVLLPQTFSFNDYLFISNRLGPEEKKKFRTKLLTRARNASRSYHRAATEFCFTLMAHEDKYGKMIEYVDSYAPYDIILKYFEPMAAADKTKLLDALIRKTGSNWLIRPDNADGDGNCFPALFKLAEKIYSADYLKLVIARLDKDKYFYFPSNRFMQYVKQQLAGQK